ncbi:histidine kinase [Burkholderiales bacterium JOSHI_001]|nr:histidine kinase [Burkholderiales bacterium JOSHI_001]
MDPNPSFAAPPRWWPALLTWALAWAAMLGLDGRLDLANLALLLVLAAALSGLWLPPLVSAAACAASVAAFNWQFVPPRGTFSVDLQQHALLLAAMLAVGWVVSGLVARQREAVRQQQALARHAEQQRALGEALRDTDHPTEAAPLLRAALSELSGLPVSLMVAEAPHVPGGPDTARWWGEPDANQRAGLWHCMGQRCAFGPGTGRFQTEPDWYLPLRGRQAAWGAALLLRDEGDRLAAQPAAWQAQAQALCDQMGQALERAQVQREAAAVRQQAQTQALRNTLLAAVAHDFRTPLATIMGAASSLHDQAERLSPAQRQRQAASIVDEARRLSRMADNTLQLARLDAAGLVLPLDWESAEEIVGTVLRHARQLDAGARVHARVEPDLPLLRCDALLLVQMLDNLVDNALKYSGSDAPVEVLARRLGDQVLLAVRDRGPGVPPAQRERIFGAFQRGPQAPAGRGAGVGLALCRAIARAHGSELTLRPRGHGGSSFECRLPVLDAPGPAPDAAAGTGSGTAGSALP